MSGICIIRDKNECKQLWKTLYPVKSIFDLWEIREIFANSYGRKNLFIIHRSEQDNKINGFLPLSWIEERDVFGFFPAETWRGRTWMEQNRIIAQDSNVLAKMLEAIPGESDIRYLAFESNLDNLFPSGKWNCCIDETGYLFYPDRYQSFSGYLEGFKGKSRKKILSEIRYFEKEGVTFRYNNIADLNNMFHLNLENFGENSYFHDPRFMDAFEKLALMLNKKGMLRVITALVNEKIAAVDMGAVWNKTCTFLAGGTSREFPGIAKFINLHHIQWACAHKDGLCSMPFEKISTLDFLCGDFGWKERFHLSPRPLYQIKSETINW
ncbi:putative cellulose biosynthesis protein CelD [Desulfamplus magnetovallimortis]|uniref:Putative cellulose biosynthesis protein CelD n=1 Tax=Desulfamplus magnetovallimortis TaxID=1246637 RepID=A0A1W1HF50_9BACT|nr:GNAT family N-acetyltransferase [Desulfamplus magnetovallimortis]SLM31005.1 putative cellulose biosynthesis protein CelD [Desulfamplus magnetovallimortis]